MKEMPPLPVRPDISPKRKPKGKIALLAAAIPVLLFLALLRPLGLLKAYLVPTGAMSPALNLGDHIVVEGLSYRAGKPRRGDIITFRTGGIGGIVSPPGTPPEGQIYIKRLAGLPGDQLRIADGKLHVNGQPVPMTNDRGEIQYTNLHLSFYHSLQPFALSSPSDTVTVPADQYYVLGDNSPQSADSRFWGFVPAGNVIGKVVFRYWPPARMGRLR